MLLLLVAELQNLHFVARLDPLRQDLDHAVLLVAVAVAVGSRRRCDASSSAEKACTGQRRSRRHPAENVLRHLSAAPFLLSPLRSADDGTLPESVTGINGIPRRHELCATQRRPRHAIRNEGAPSMRYVGARSGIATVATEARHRGPGACASATQRGLSSLAREHLCTETLGSVRRPPAGRRCSPNSADAPNLDGMSMFGIPGGSASKASSASRSSTRSARCNRQSTQPLIGEDS